MGDTIYSFGLEHKGYNKGNIGSTNIALKRKFGGKEHQDELGLGWYDITTRNYDPALDRWMNVDPLAEKMPEWSAYSFGFNNPIRFVDPDGRAPHDVVGDPPGKVIAVFYHGGPTGGGQQTTVSNAGYTGNIYTSTQSSATNSGRDFTGTIIAPGVTSASGVSTGLDFINQNYEAEDQLVIYGYSYGVDVDLTHNLNNAGINVDLLVTVDGSDGPLQSMTVNTTIPENVGTNLNVYQTSNSGASSSSRSTGSSSGVTSSSSGSNSSGSSN